MNRSTNHREPGQVDNSERAAGDLSYRHSRRERLTFEPRARPLFVTQARDLRKRQLLETRPTEPAGEYPQVITHAVALASPNYAEAGMACCFSP